MKLIMIAAVGANRELGKDNDLIWRLREDMKYFKEHTIGHPIVMGRRTYESLPHLLPRRKHIVISRSHPVLPDEVVLYSSVDAFVEAYKNKDEEIYVIGGASIYQQLLPYADELLLDGDRCFS
ncbi:MAG: dihydrofolate reductase [Catenisphaera adipataccumulans]|uniref:dihydrofolate reductase n=1 Tax=Catenisphaera adipataccumulans TaxID=700500 RepID=UPI003D935418